MPKITGTAQVYMLGKYIDTVIHLVNIPSFYHRSYPEQNSLKNKIFFYTISIYDNFGNLILNKNLEIQALDSLKISIKDLTKDFLKEDFNIGQFVLSHSSSDDFLCNFYTTFKQKLPNTDFKIFKLHSHQIISLKPKSFKGTLKKYLIYIFFKLHIYKYTRKSAALNSWSIRELRDKSLNLLIANHGYSKKENYIILSTIDKSLNNITKKKIKLKAPPLGCILLNLDKYLDNINKKNKFKISIAFQGLGTLSLKPILILTNRECSKHENFFHKKEIMHIQHI